MWEFPVFHNCNSFFFKGAKNTENSQFSEVLIPWLFYGANGAKKIWEFPLVPDSPSFFSQKEFQRQDLYQKLY